MENTENAVSERQQKINDARLMLDFLEANPEVALPYIQHNNIWLPYEYNGPTNAERFHRHVELFGDAEISYTGNACRNSEKVVATKRFGTCELVIEIDRKEVCTKKEVTKTAEEWEPFNPKTPVAEAVSN